MNLVFRICFIFLLGFFSSGHLQAQECFDSPPLNDGWGWNGVESCRVEIAVPTCVDSPPAGDGWGWNGITSCRLEVTDTTCIDSPPLNDGWGWNGITSCQVGENQNTTDSALTSEIDRSPSITRCTHGNSGCLDTNGNNILPGSLECTDADGDGWGWDGVQSCADIGSNLIRNGTFSNGSSYWTTFVHADAVDTYFSFSDAITGDGILRVAYSNSGSNRLDTQAYSAPFALQADQRYRLAFDNQTFNTRISTFGSVVIENASDFTEYHTSNFTVRAVSTDRLLIEFYMPVSDNNVQVTFNFGGNRGAEGGFSGSGTIDNVTLKAVE